MTAVEFLKQNLPSLFVDDSGHYENLFQKTLELEKQQIIDAANIPKEQRWYENKYDSCGEQYYFETYKKNDMKQETLEEPVWKSLPSGDLVEMVDFLIKKLNIAKAALNHIASWNDDLEYQYGDPGECAAEALIKIRNL
jgi:hypothetical protein